LSNKPYARVAVSLRIANPGRAAGSLLREVLERRLRSILSAGGDPALARRLGLVASLPKALARGSETIPCVAGF